MSPIPWTAILTHGPALVAAAQRLLAKADASRAADTAKPIDARLAALEQTSEESAVLLQQVAQQLQALTAAQQDLDRRTRAALRLAAGAAALAAAALVVAAVL